MTRGVRILGVDPGFANLGVLGARFSAQGSVRIEVAATLVTAPSPKKRRRREMDDEGRRLGELIERFQQIAASFKPDVIASEQRPQLRSQKSTAQAALAFAMVQTQSVLYGAQFLVYTINEIKKRVCGDGQATKDQIIEALTRMDPKFSGWPITKRIEHCADAGGAALCALRDPVVEVMLQERARASR